jgi:uncharacterized protein
MQGTSNDKMERSEAASQLLLFAMLLLVGFVVMVLATSMMASFFPNDINDSHQIVGASLLRVAQLVQFAFLMFAPVVVYLHFFSTDDDKKAFLPSANIRVYLFAALAFVMALPFVDFMAALNQNMVFPAWLSGLDTWVREGEARTNEMVSLWLGTSNTMQIVVNGLLIVLAPAVCEEFLFRGIIQRKLAQWWQKPYLAIVVTAFLFSAIHFQFLTFLPRFVQGIALGYLFYATGSVWVAVAAHFANNMLAFAIYYYHRFYLPDVDPMQLNSSNGSAWLVVLSAVLAIVFLWLIKQESYRRLPLDT